MNRRQPCIKNPQTQEVVMSLTNIKICLKNQQDSFESLDLNESLHLQYNGFLRIANLQPFVNVHTLYLNNNGITQISNLECLRNLCTLNLSSNCIKQLRGLNCLGKLQTLDISTNLLQQVVQEETIGLSNLSACNLAGNHFMHMNSLQGIFKITTLTSLNLSRNEQLQGTEECYPQLSKMARLTLLNLTGTLVTRAIPAYRKRTISELKPLLFLDDRPVTEDERRLAQAWRQGGIQLERAVRQTIRQGKLQKSNKIYQGILECNRIRNEKIETIYQKLTHKQSRQLAELKLKHKQESDLLDELDKQILEVSIQDLTQYLRLMQAAVRTMDVDQILKGNAPELPTMLLEKQTADAIYIYHVSQEQIPLIKEKYYPEQTKPLVAVNYPSAEERWVKQYDTFLEDAHRISRQDIRLLVPIFNLSVYEFDQATSRKLKRFESKEVQQRLTELSLRLAEQSRQELNELD